MDKPNFLVLLNERLKKELLNLPTKERERLFEKFSYLENGMWDTGVKVKKLKGPGKKVIFEGRLNKGDRVLFTLGRENGQTCIYLWGIVHHDAIGQEAKRICPDNAPFLEFESLQEEFVEDFLIDKMPGNFFTQESLDQKVEEDYGPQKWLEMTEPELQRLLEKPHPEFFEMFLHLTGEQRQVLGLKPPILISGTAGSGKTTLAVYYLFQAVAHHKRVIFLTCSSHLKQYAEDLYKGLLVDSVLPYQPGIVEFHLFGELVAQILEEAQVPFDPKLLVDFNQFKHIFGKHNLSQSYDAELVWEEIRSIIKGAAPPIRLGHLKILIDQYLDKSISINGLHSLKETLLSLKDFVIVGKFDRIIRHRTPCDDFIEFIHTIPAPAQQQTAAFDGTLGEILRILKNKEPELSSVLLPLPEYLNLGRKRAPNFLYDRDVIYDIALYYQNRLEADRRFDEIDLCKRATQELDLAADRFLYDLVICDEIQDLSDIEIALLFRLTRTSGNIICAGDQKQIINPSGFRWEEVKRRFYERGMTVPDVRYLNYNFRCVGDIVKLSNVLLKLKQRLVGISGYEQMEDWKFNGRPPLLFHGLSESRMLERIGATAAGSTILVRSSEEKKVLVRSLGTELIFTISEAKGLEFDTVLLWKFSGDPKVAGIWRKIADKHLLKDEHHALVRHEINLLYVASTRARNALIIYDGTTASPVWSLPELQAHVFISSETESLDKMWQRVSTTGEWYGQGTYFFARERYVAAKECFRNAGETQWEEICDAHILLQENRYREAGKVFNHHGKTLEAAKAYEAAGDYAVARELWKRLGDTQAMTRCTINTLEQNGEYMQAAEIWLKNNDINRVVENWKRARAYAKLADHYFNSKEYAVAAQYFNLDGNTRMEARCQLNSKDYVKAATNFLKAKDYASALPIFKRLKDNEKTFVCLKALHDDLGMAELHERLKQYEQAVSCFSAYARQSQENALRLLETAQEFYARPRQKIKAALRFSALGTYDLAAAIFQNKKIFQLAAINYKLAGNLRGAAECYASLGNHDQAVTMLHAIGNRESFEKSVDILRDSMFVNYSYQQHLIQDCYDTAMTDFRSHKYGEALTRFIAVNQLDDVYGCVLKVTGRDEEVLDYLMGMDRTDLGLKLVESKPKLTIGATYLQQLIDGNPNQYIYYLIPTTSPRKEFLLFKLLKRLYDEKAFPEIKTLALRYLANFGNLFYVNELPETFIDLILDVKHYNLLYDCTTYTNAVSGIPKREFKDRLVRTARATGDELLEALADGHTGPRLDPLLEKLEIDQTNFRLFGESKKLHQQALEYLLEKGMKDDAIKIYFRHGRTKEVAKLYESNDDPKRAATIYRDNNYFSDAIRCYEKLGKRDGIARTYERMLEFDQAKAIWRELGKPKEIARLEKKIGKLGSKQPELF